MGHLWKCKQLEIEEMAVCLSVGPGQGGSWIKAFQQIVSIISLLLLPLPTFFTIPAPARFLLRVSLHLVAAPTVALFHQSGRSHPLAVEFEMGCLCGLCATWYLKCQRQTRSFKESKDWWRETMMPKNDGENMKVMLKLYSPSLFPS